MTGTTNINDPDNPNDYMATGYLQISGTRGEIALRRQALPLNGNFELIWPFVVNQSASVFITSTLISSWGASGDDSTIRLWTISVSRALDGYCAGEVPEL